MDTDPAGKQTTQLVVVVGDIHHHLWLAVDGLEQMERDFGRSLDQVFSVGDFGLFLDESDWDYLTGPKKYRRPEDSARIRSAWERWRWPVSMIAGNHEPFHKLRDWNPEHFDGKLDYTDAGLLAHRIPGLRVAGLSGIFHPDELEFISEIERKQSGMPKPGSWPEMVEESRRGRVSHKRLSYYKQAEVDAVAALTPRPHLLLTHDWPTSPEGLRTVTVRRPEGELLDALSPQFHCCGHHHRAHRLRIAETEVVALNIMGGHQPINSGWAIAFEWDGAELTEIGLWPQSLKEKED